MFKKNLKIAVRTLLREKSYASLNVLGLTIGLTCVSFIAAWCHYELSYDRFHSKQERIFRIAGKVTTDSETFNQAVTSPPMAAALKRDYPEIENAVRLDMNDCIVRYGKQQFLEDGVLFTDPSFFEIFDYRLSHGDVQTALSDPNSIVLTESIARKYFGNENPIGKFMTMYVYDPGSNGAPYKITGVMPDPPINAHFTFTILGSFATYEAIVPQVQDFWFENGYYTYVLLQPGADPAALERKLP
ncbi:ABC transporter permease, partial [bacterium]|nr:ABC transporter permease [bacterium]